MAQGLEAYEATYRERLLWNLKHKAGALGYELRPWRAGGKPQLYRHPAYDLCGAATGMNVPATSASPREEA